MRFWRIALSKDFWRYGFDEWRKAIALVLLLLCTIAKKRNQSESLNETLAIITYGYFSILW